MSKSIEINVQEMFRIFYISHFKVTSIYLKYKEIITEMVLEVGHKRQHIEQKILHMVR